MKHRRLRIIIVFGSILLSSLLTIQGYWLLKAFSVSEQQFDHSVMVALNRVADSITSSNKIERMSSGFYLVEVNAPIDVEQVQAQLQKELNKRSLSLDWEIGVYNAVDDSLVYGNYISASAKKTNYVKEFPKREEVGDENFAIYFPNRSWYLASEVSIWIFSTIVLLLMIGFFAYAIFSLLREKRFSELKNDFINNMTHEFKTPITNIGLATESLRKRGIPDSSDIYLEIINRENEKIKHKIDAVLLGANERFADRLSLSRVDIHELIHHVADLFQFKISQRNGRIELNLEAESAVVQGDRELLLEAISNLVDNAEKYSHHTPVIQVTTAIVNESIVIRICDQGIGVPDHLCAKVFDKFYRVDTGYLHNVKGFGLGLSFVKNVIRSHHGKIKLSSGHDIGTEVKVILPFYG